VRREGVVALLAGAGCIAPEAEADLLFDATEDPAALAASVRRRASGEPLEHVLGWAAFVGRRVRVGPGVFVPRPRSEPLARRATALLVAAERPRVAVDLCTGSGAVAAVLAAAVRDARVLAVDDDGTALAFARLNGTPLGVEVLEGDLDAPLPPDVRGTVAVLTAVVPYVPSAQLAYMPGEARDHEPRRALDGGTDGLDVLRRVAVAARSVLRPGGHVLLELAEHQAAAAADVVAGAGLVDVVLGWDRAEDDEDEVTFIEAVRAPA
jgi:release factor glutamine methyltransferase